MKVNFQFFVNNKEQQELVDKMPNLMDLNFTPRVGETIRFERTGKTAWEVHHVHYDNWTKRGWVAVVQLIVGRPLE